MRFPLVVTEDGYGKRILFPTIRRTGRGTMGVMVSSLPVAFSAVVTEQGELVLASAYGRLERIAVAEVPVRTRKSQRGRGQSKGVRLIALDDADRVTAGAVTSAYEA